MQSLSLQFLPLSHASLLRTTPLSAVATGEGCEYRQYALVHLGPNLQSVGDWGRSGATNPARCADEAEGAVKIAEVDAAGVGVGEARTGIATAAIASWSLAASETLGVVADVDTAPPLPLPGPPLPLVLPRPLPPPFITPLEPPICCPP